MSHRLGRLVSALAVASVAHGAGAQIYVDDDAPAGGDGTSWERAFNDLQDALHAWEERGPVAIHVAAGWYPGRAHERDGFVVEGPDVLSAAGLTICGGFGGLANPGEPDLYDPATFVTTISGDALGDDDEGGFDDNSLHVVRVTASFTGSLVFKGLTIADGRARGSEWLDGVGAAVLSTAPAGLVFRECIIEDHDGVFGGAVHAPLAESVAFVSSTIRRNAGFDGAVVIAGPLGRVKFFNCIVTHNASERRGGVVYAAGVGPESLDVQFGQCLLAHNRAWEGGVVWASDCWTNMSGCTVVGNGASRGGVFALQGHMGFALGQSTIADNAASMGGAVGWLENLRTAITVAECVVEGGAGAIAAVESDDLWYVMNVEEFAAFRDVIGPDGIAASGDEDYRPSGACPGLDARLFGDNDEWDIDGDGNAYERVEVDLAGQPRWRRVRADYGAYEYQCIADMSGSTDPADPWYLRPDGVLDATDFFGFLDRFAAADIAADLTGSSDPTDVWYGRPDGEFTADDLFYYIDKFVEGCP